MIFLVAQQELTIMKNKYYQHFLHASQQLANIESIDYYLANQLAQTYQQMDDAVLYHVFMALSENLRQGHTCLPLTVIAGQCWAASPEKAEHLAKMGFQFPELAQLTQLFSHEQFSEAANTPIIYWRGCLYLRRYFIFEQQLAAIIYSKLNNANKNVDIEQAKQCLQAVFPDSKQTKSKASVVDWQMISVANALNKNFSIIAGGPGTGKTYTVTKLLAAIILRAQKLQIDLPRIAMVAPTGKAAQRLSESISKTTVQLSGKICESILKIIPEQAQTIHRLLGVIPQQVYFRHHQDNLLPIDVLLIDEASMVDLALMTRLLKALPSHCQVILLGDADQLPSVQSGSVLNELAPKPHIGYSIENIRYLQELTGQNLEDFQVNSTQSGYDHLTLLTQSRRFDGKGGIALLANAVISGDSHQSWQLLQQEKQQLQLLEETTLLTDNEDFSALIASYYFPLLIADKLIDAFALFKQFRVLVATRKGKNGVEQLNMLIKEHLKQLFQQKENKPLDINKLYHGQPIMISENNYQIGLFNGDIGFIWRDSAGHLMAVFEGEEQQDKQGGDQTANYRRFMISQLPQYETVYAMTIHKTQGSEFDHVFMVLPEQSEHQLLSRELLYTGITRAKKQLSVLSKKHVWQQAVKQKVVRYANLARRLALLAT